MPLLRMAARTAVVAGTATAVSGRVAHRQDEKWSAQQQAEYDQQQAAAPPPAAAPAASGGLSEDSLAKLKQLADLKDQGVLSEAEFEVQKEKILQG